MRFEDGKMKDVQIAYIGGGSRGWAWTFMTDLALEDALGGTIRLYDIDEAAAESNKKIGNHLMAREDAKGEWTFEVYRSLKEALTGCDFVVISILPGSFDDMEIDVHLPERLGIWQSVGDTAGPGGMIRAMRTIPMFVTIAEAIRDFCPNAWVINYTNPMSLCVKALYETFPEIKAFGCCHEVFGTQKVLQTIYEKETGDKITDWHDVYVNVVGINHFTWFTEASYKGTDLFPIYDHFIEGHFDEGVELESENWLNANFRCKHRVKMDLFKKYGLIAAAGDRHLAEFMSGDNYLKDPDTVKSWDFTLTSVAWRKQDLEERLARSRRLASFEEEMKLEPTGEEGILLIKALCGLCRVVSNVNIPNKALQIPNLPRDSIVETNAVFSRDSIRPIFAGAVPENVKELVMPHIRNHKRIMKAASTGDRNLVVEAFMDDPLVRGKNCSKADVESLVNDMLDKTT